jgi:PAS domain S-box-containing protein
VEVPDLAQSNKKNVIRVLHVDDDQAIREITKMILLDLDSSFEIEWACCVDEAFRKLATEQYDIVISDYEMPQKDGLAFLKELRKQKSDIPFVLFTGKGREEVAIQALNLGADGYINKQGNPETVYGELAHTLRLSVENHQSKIEIAINALAFQNVDNAIITADQTQTIVSWNKAAENVFGYSANEAKGNTIDGIFVPMQIEVTFQEITRAIQDKGRFFSEISYKNKKGEYRYGELTILSQLNGSGKVSGSTIICHDLTKHRKTEEALLASNRRYEIAQRAANAGVWEWDVKTGEIKWTVKMFELFGLDQKKEAASFAVWESALHPEDKEGAKANIEKALQNHSFLDNEYKIVMPDGEIRWINALGEGEYDFQGNPLTMSGICIDITQRKKEQELLKESLAAYSNLINGMSDSAWVIDFEGNFIDVNRAAVETLGHSKKELLTIGIKGIDKHLSPEQIKNLIDNLDNVETQVFETVHTKKDGNEIPVEISSSLITYQGKKAILSIARNISERKQAELELKQYNEILESVGEGIDAGLAVIDRNYNVVWANKRLLDLGIDPNKKCYETFSKLGIVCPDCGVEKIFQENALLDVHEYKTVNSKGETIWIELRVTPLKDKEGNVTAALELVVPITERKEVEDSLRKSEAKYREFADSLPEIIFEADATTGKPNFVNKKALEIMGYSINEIKQMNIFQFLAPEELQRAKKNIQRRLSGEKTVGNEYTIIRKDGSTFPGMIFTEKIITEDGKLGLRGIIVNISQTKKSAKDLQLFAEKLRVVGGLTRHDVGNKLATIGGNEFLLRKRLGDKPELFKYLDGIKTAIAASEKIFEFSHFYEKIGGEKPAIIDVFECFNVAAALFSNLTTIRIVNECQGLKVVADSLLRQIFYNLIDNSLKHGEKVTQIRLHYTKKADKVKLFYEDNGVGVPETNKCRLFDVGFTTGKGSGLGLALIKRMIEVYGWTITEEGQPGKGAKFTITIQKPSNRKKELPSF